MKFSLKRLYVVLCSMLLIGTPNFDLQAQKMERAEILMVDGKTKKGYIEYKNELKKIPVLKYHKSRKADVVKITPEEVEEFTVNKHLFKSAEVSVESSSHRKKELSPSKEPVFRTDHAFLLAVVEGPKSLYYYKDDAGKEHFLIKEDGEYKTLVYKKYADYFGTVIRMRENRMYIGQLAQYLKTDDWRVDFSSYTYDISKLKELFLFYYRVNGLEPDYIDAG